MIKVIVVEDEDMIRKGFIHTINWLEMGCQVIDEACNGEEGLEKIIKYQPDLVITDINMPKMTGLQFMEKLSKLNLKLTVIIVSTIAKEGAKIHIIMDPLSSTSRYDIQT